jgi:hypothetical protein
MTDDFSLITELDEEKLFYAACVGGMAARERWSGEF